jgi:fimbrial isopeptide formation D2 family protein/LPXTG-motif cell wall-anchored protein
MKHLRRLMAIMVSIIMSMGMMSVSAFAENNGIIEVKNTHNGQVYELYQLFDATTVDGRVNDGNGISYKLMSGKSDFKVTVNGNELDGSTWFKIDNGGNVVIKDNTAQAAITDDNADFAAWAKAYGVKNTTSITASTDSAEVIWTGLAEGYYFITTTTGSLVSIDSIKPNAEVNDKNPGTSVSKVITGANSIDEEGEKALAQVGTTVSYESRIPISRGAYNYTFTDTMTKGLTLDASSVKVYVVNSGAKVADETSDVNSACGTVTADNQTNENIADITVVFDDAWLKTNWEKDIVIQYSATVNKDAVIADASNPNTAKITYGNKDNPLTNEDTADVYSAKITVKKVDGENKALEGAGFKLKNSDNKWYVITDGIVSWADTEAGGTEILPVKGTGTQTDAVASFTGLADGTYTLVETTVPGGYNKAPDKTVTIDPAKENNWTTELTVESTVTNNQGTELPSTGGIGTTIFYIVGGVMVAGAVVFLLTKRRVADKE